MRCFQFESFNTVSGLHKHETQTQIIYNFSNDFLQLWTLSGWEIGTFLSLFVSFQGDLESKLAIREPNKKCLVDKYTEESNGIALF